MAENPITTPLPADLPTDWTYGQTIGASGTDVGLTEQHGYNYLMQQVNAAQQAASQIGAAFSGIPSLGSDGKVPPEQLPEMDFDEAGSAAAVQKNLDAHTSDKDNPHGVTAKQVGARPDTWVPSWGDVSGKPSAFPPSAHTHNAEQVTAGTLAGKVLANAASAADVTASQLRNIYAGTSDMTAGSSSLATGCLYLVYE